jgi:S1-C subfamily serine protease
VPSVTTETVIVPTSIPAPSYIRQGGGLPPSTTEIPQSIGAPEPAAEEIDRNAADAQVITYEAQQNPQLIEPQLHSLQEFISEDDESSPLGMELREERRKLNSGEVANGLLIVGVRDGSAAAKGGLHACQRTARNVLEGAAVAASLFFPPAVLAVPLLEQVSLGDSYDMIIGVDGTRVANFLDFEDRMRDVQPGEIVYLSIVRNGDRVQVPVHVQTLSPAVF